MLYPPTLTPSRSLPNHETNNSILVEKVRQVIEWLAKTEDPRRHLDKLNYVEFLHTVLSESGSQLTSAPFAYNSRKHEKKKPQGPLGIPALKGRDWRELAGNMCLPLQKQRPVQAAM